jgi:mRNA-degrading endonuclease RelE of RelBE toxin-antitoxin system
VAPIKWHEKAKKGLKKILKKKKKKKKKKDKKSLQWTVGVQRSSAPHERG